MIMNTNVIYWYRQTELRHWAAATDERRRSRAWTTPYSAAPWKSESGRERNAQVERSDLPLALHSTVSALHEEDGEGTDSHHTQKRAKSHSCRVCSVSCNDLSHLHTRHFNPHLCLCSVFQKQFCCMISNFLSKKTPPNPPTKLVLHFRTHEIYDCYICYTVLYLYLETDKQTDTEILLEKEREEHTWNLKLLQNTPKCCGSLYFKFF